MGNYWALTVQGDPKSIKGEPLGYRTAVQFLAPSDLSGVINLCGHSTDGCVSGCLNKAGLGQFDNIQQARIKRTRFFVSNREAYWRRLVYELMMVLADAEYDDLDPVARLNGVSDLPWERMRVQYGNVDAKNIMQMFPQIQFYDYTKYPERLRPEATLPSNYHLTYSYSEGLDAESKRALDAGRNVAAVMRSPSGNGSYAKWRISRPTEWAFGGTTYPVIDGTEHDLRFLDPKGVVVGLRPLGPAVNDTTGFVLN
jgi:hypothetical protein